MKKKMAVKTYTEIFKAERKTFPQGYCVTRVIPPTNGARNQNIS